MLLYNKGQENRPSQISDELGGTLRKPFADPSQSKAERQETRDRKQTARNHKISSVYEMSTTGQPNKFFAEELYSSQ